MSSLVETEESTRISQAPRMTKKRLPLLASPGDILAELGIEAPPVDPKQIAEAYGFRVQVVPRVEWHGRVLLDEKTICVNSAADRYLQRFIVAHEFAHAVLHGHLRREFVDTFSGQSVVDHLTAQAGEFALDLLMPRNWLVARIGYLSTSSMAEVFDVPPGAIRARVKSLGL
jgi:hypothetical protein